MPNSVSLLEFTGRYHADEDHTTAIRAAQLAATAELFDIDVPALTFNYSDLIPGCSRPMRGVGIGRSIFMHIGVNGTNARWAYTGDDIEVSGISFRVANTPALALNDADEEDGILAFDTCNNLMVRDLEFVGCYGGAVLTRHCEDFDLLRLRGRNLYKDFSHIAGRCKNGRRIGCTVHSGGDDAYAIVGMIGQGQPDGIIDKFNFVRGSKFARGFAYVGCKNVRNDGCISDGLMPSGFATQAPGGENYRMLSGLYIADEAGFGTYQNENIEVNGMQVRNCGYTSEFSSAALSAVHLVGRSGHVSKTIHIDGISIENVGTRGVFVNGGTADGIEDWHITGKIKNNNDPNGWFVGRDGAGCASGIEVQNVKNPSIDLTLDNIGSYGVVVATSCTGHLDLKLKPSDINSSGTAGVDIANIAANGNLTSIIIQIDIIKQSTVAAPGTPYYLERIVECVNAGKVESLIVNDYANLGKSCALAVPARPIAVTASPFSWTNPHPIQVNVRMNGGTVSQVERAQSTGVASPVYGVVPGKTQGLLLLQPGATVRTTFSGALTMDYFPSTC